MQDDEISPAAGEAEKVLTKSIPLAIEQAAACLQDVVSIHKFLRFYSSQYDNLMNYVPERTSWFYDKNISIFTTFEMLFRKRHRPPVHTSSVRLYFAS